METTALPPGPYGPGKSQARSGLPAEHRADEERLRPGVVVASYNLPVRRARGHAAQQVHAGLVASAIQVVDRNRKAPGARVNVSPTATPNWFRVLPTSRPVASVEFSWVQLPASSVLKHVEADDVRAERVGRADHRGEHVVAALRLQAPLAVVAAIEEVATNGEAAVGQLRRPTSSKLSPL